MDRLVQLATEKWEGWLGAPPGDLEMAMLSRGSRTSRRIVALIGEQGSEHPSVVIKGTPLVENDTTLAAEANALTSAASTIPAQAPTRPPRLLDSFEAEGWGFIATSRVPGRPLALPGVTRTRTKRDRAVWTRYVEGTCDWTASLARATVSPNGHSLDELIRLLDPIRARVGGQMANSTLSAVETALQDGDPWHSAWQHGDVAIGNVLVDGPDLQYVDWERANDEGPVWRDLAYLPIVTVMLAMHETRTSNVTEAMKVLDPNTWLGGLIKEQVESHWVGPPSVGIGVLLTTLQTAAIITARGDGREQPWLAAAEALLSDQSIRHQIQWICPDA